jgi:peptidoglycan/xylan/chitin deacetylase (PgdA/CDA1 family)
MKENITCVPRYELTRRAVGISIGSLLLLFPSCTALAANVSTTTPKTGVKEVALTFDDGPYGTSTLEVLDILQREKVPATFFLIGKNVEKYPDIARLIVADGYMVGNHTYDHPKNLPYLTNSQIATELSKADTVIASTTGIHTKLFRPPYGKINKRLRKILTADGYKVVLWNVDPTDWDYPSSTSTLIEKRVIAQEKTEMTIVMHDGRDTHINYPRGNLVGALPTVIENLKQQGYVFVTADKLVSQRERPHD